MDVVLTSSILLLSTAVPVAVGLTWYGWRNRSLPGVVPFLFLVPFCTIWAVALALELVLPTLSAKLIASDAQFLGISCLPVAALAMAIDYSGRRALLSSRNVLLACIVPLVTVILTFTNGYHHLMTTRVFMLSDGPIKTVGRTWGVWFWIHSGYSYALLLGTLAILIAVVRSTPRVYRRQPVAILTGMCVPIVSHAFHATLLSHTPGWDFTPVALIIAGLTVGWGLIGVRLFVIVPVARHALVENLSDGVLVLDRADRVIDLNESARKLIDRPLDQILTQPLLDSWPTWREKIARGLATADQVDFDLEAGDGHRHYEVKCSSLERNHMLMGKLVIVRDVTQRVLMEDNLREQALTDSLTGLPNRTLFMSRLADSVERAGRENRRRFAVMVLDLDRFKLINDSIGHLAGDVLLRSVADKLKSCVRDTDTVARMGGDEFMIILHGISNARDLIPILDRIQEELRTPVYFRQQEMTAGSSVGVVIWNPKYNDAEDLLRAADTAMYQAKEAGRGCHRIFDEAMHEEVTRTLRAETDLRTAIRKRSFSMSYQPVADLRTGRVRSVEALLRWQHPTRGTVYPQEFIGIAENGGLMVELGDIALNEVCGQISRWQSSASPAADLKVNLNISPRQLTEPDFAGAVLRRLAEWRISAERLTFEITEKALTRDPHASGEALGGLRAMGISLALDDFGSGASSLQHLTGFPVEELKIDRTFISRIAPTSTELEIVRSLVALAHTLGLRVTGEGVERSEQWHLLSQLGCDSAQGFYVGKPMSPDELVQYLVEIHGEGHDFGKLADAVCATPIQVTKKPAKSPKVASTSPIAATE